MMNDFPFHSDIEIENFKTKYRALMEKLTATENRLLEKE